MVANLSRRKLKRMPKKEKPISRGLALMLLLVLASGATGSFSQSTAAPSSPPVSAADRFWPDVSVNVVVLDKQGAPQTIDEKSFRLYEDGAERTLHFPVQGDTRISLGLLIDFSGSTYERKPEIVSAANAILRALPAESEIVVVDFSYAAFIDLPFTPVSKADLSVLDKVQPRGLTTLWDSVIATETYFAAYAKYPRRALVILSDGEDNASQASKGTAIRKLEQLGAPVVYSCRIHDKSTLAESIRGSENLKFLAKEGGGMEFNLGPDPASTAAQIVAVVRDQYVLQFTAANTTRDGRSHKLKVQVPDKDMQVRFLPTYFAPEE